MQKSLLSCFLRRILIDCDRFGNSFNSSSDTELKLFPGFRFRKNVRPVFNSPILFLYCPTETSISSCVYSVCGIILESSPATPNYIYVLLKAGYFFLFDRGKVLHILLKYHSGFKIVYLYIYFIFIVIISKRFDGLLSQSTSCMATKNDLAFFISYQVLFY